MRTLLALALALACSACVSKGSWDEGGGPDGTPRTSPTPWPAPTPFGEPLTLVRQLPHANWSEGLDFHDGELWSAFPHILKVYDPETGEVLREMEPPSDYSESLAWRDGELWNVSYDDANIYVGTPQPDGSLVWRIAGTTPEIHGWGITHDASHVIVTGNGTPFLYFLDPVTTELARTVETPIDDLEDLAWDRGAIWASSYSAYSGQFFRLDPSGGTLVEVFALPDPSECEIVDGIAVHGSTLYVTGKDCPWIYVYEMP